MSDLKAREKALFEKLFDMRSGYVMDFTNDAFAEFFKEHSVDIYAEKYAFNGNSKVKRLRAFWKKERNDVVTRLLRDLFDYWRNLNPDIDAKAISIAKKCEVVIQRLLSVCPFLNDLEERAVKFNTQYLAQQIRRMKQSVDTDSALAIGTAKELVETCCYSILAKRGKPVKGIPSITTLTEETMRELNVVPEGVPERAKGSENIKRLLSNLVAIVQRLAEFRGVYSTGHGKEGGTKLLGPCRFRLTVGAGATLTRFLFETHTESMT